MKITFIGAAQEVTGSCFLVEADDVRFLVDCGMVQGGREALQRNHEAWPFDPRSIDFVLLTHAHIDHSGLLPRLYALGFRGTVHTTPTTVDLLSVMLLDSAFIQESEWVRAQRKRQQKHERSSQALAPLYTVAQAQACLTHLEGVPYDTEAQPHESVRCRFRDAGHIIGSAIVEVWVSERGHTRKLVFSGDLGQPGRPIVRDPTPIEDADVLLVESTYGNRLHRPQKETVDELVEIVNDVMSRRQGNIIIPAFALGRTQDLIYLLADLCRQGRLPHLQVFVDSPMAHKVSNLTLKHREVLDPETQTLIREWEHHPEWLDLHFTPEVEQSIALNRIKAGAIIVSASGMCEAGRIRHHLRHHLGRPECAIVIIGFQAEGTLGRRLVDGHKHVRLFGEEVAVRASIHTLGGLSAHGDQAALMGWLSHFKTPPRRTFIVHGESETACGFAQKISQDLGWTVEAPAKGTQIHL